MSLKSKKLIALFLIFSLLTLSANLYAKERRGAKLIVTKTDGQKIRGELITVKPNSLLLLDTDGKDVSIDIVDIKVIRVVKKSKVGKGAGIGFAIGALVGVSLALVAPDGASTLGYFIGAGAGGVVGAILGVLIGALRDAVSKGSKTIQIEGMTDSEIQETMDKLRKKARIRDYR